MYKGKFEAPKGAPRPKRAAAKRRIEDIPLSAAAQAAQPIPQQAAPTASQDSPSKPIPREAAQNVFEAIVPEKSEDVLAGLAAIPVEEASQPAPAAISPSGSDKLVPMETLSLRHKEIHQEMARKNPRPASDASSQPKDKKKKKASKGTVAFYAIYFMCIALCFAFIAGVLSYLDGWLVKHEKSQPKVQSQQVFDSYFADPDWGELYDAAGLSDTAYEGKDQFVKYMTEKVGEEELRYVATASGDPEKLSKYLVKLGDERIASFTLSADSDAKIKQWQLSSIEIFFKRAQSVTVCAGSGQTVYVNGVALGEEHIVRTTVTLAENYLPEGLHGHSSATYYLDGLLMAPTVEVKNAQGESVAVTYDASAGQYNAETAKASFTLSDKDRSAAIAAAKVLSEFRIEMKDRTALARHFDKNSDYYKATVSQDTWMQNNLLKSYKFSEPVVSEYYMYSDELFSVHVDMTLFVTRTNGTVKEWDASGTFFFSKRSDGTWIVTDTNKIRLQQEVTKVRLTYMNGSEVIASELVDSASVQLEPPQVVAPEGKRFAGWYQETVDENGKAVLSLAFQTDPETGLAYLGTGVQLEPMVLHAHFENEGVE